MLKQFRNTGLYKVSLDDFKELLDIPSSYQMSDIDKRVLKPIQRDLADSFQNLEVKKIKKGRKVVALEFTFDKENLKKKKNEQNEIKIDEELRKQSEEMFKEFIK
ncbi:replication initiation protein [Macrococcus armenti]|uniref:replication initiation protein n=1 Tax=Macrococcus armenti TaxID=2875764 RepID=UPI001F4C7439